MSVEPNAHTACGAAAWLRHIRAAVAGALFVAGCSAFAASLQIVSLAEVKPGSVIATVRTADNQPPTTAFHLLFPTAAPGAQDFTAKEVTPVTDASADLATTTILCVDRSGSMRLVVPSMKAALRDAFASPRPDLRASLLSFGTTVSKQLQPLSNDPAQVKRALDGIQAEHGPDGKTLLYDAIILAINRLKDDPGVHAGSLLVISDGKDEGSSIALDNLVNDAKMRGYPIDSIGYGKLAPASSGSLAALSRATGGKFVLAQTDAQLSDAIRDDLGTKPLPAFRLRFDYPASSAKTPAGAAMLQYAVAGASTASVPVTVPLAAPEANAIRPASTQAAAAAPAENESWLDALKKRLAGSSALISIRFTTLTAALLALLAALAWIFLLRRTKKPPPEKIVDESIDAPPASTRPVRAQTQISPDFPAPRQGEPAAWLIGRSGHWRGKRYPIERAMIHVGSDEKCELAVTGDDYVSRRHATIRYEAGGLYLADLSSTNGTFLNGTRVSQTPSMLVAGDDIRFGHTSFELRDANEDAPAPRRNGDRHRVP
ncbi:FHA domain-containing protein [Trinickia violacea]|uniref:FHA domain-containing protein n=1 Tax=Trinickia violacea TaxID=2571746 RepID=A0A4P8IPD2_9BURK|nr:FHA domain-containing protein [Trinickia violacea]QCP49817.1 FHA domain-containing protein [Trinickia violacea]